MKDAAGIEVTNEAALICLVLLSSIFSSELFRLDFAPHSRGLARMEEEVFIL